MFSPIRNHILRALPGPLPDRHYLITTTGFYLLLIMLAVSYGLLAITAHPVVIGLGIGLLVGSALLFKPKWNIWLVLILGLAIIGLLPLHFSFIGSKAAWGVSLLSFIVMASALLRLITQPDSTRNTPAFIWLALAFICYAVIDSLLQWNTSEEFLTGFKRYFQTFGLMFALAWLVIDKKEIQRWRMLLLLVALLQLPFALYERIIIVPLREAMRDSVAGIVPIDVVSGTFCAQLYGGGAAAEMATFLLIAFAFLIARKREGLLTGRRLALLSLLILPPLFLGETKVIILILPLTFLVLYRKELLSQPHKAFIGLVMASALTVAAGYAYLNIMGKNLHDTVESTLDYNIYGQGYGLYALNRTTTLSFWAERQRSHGPVSMIFGNGLGSAHDATGGHIAMRYSGYGVGLTAVSTLLWDLGIFGTALFFSILVYAWWCANRVRKRTTEAWVRADTLAIQAALAIFIFYPFYRLALLETMSFQIIFALILGYLAWLHRRQVAGDASES